MSKKSSYKPGETARVSGQYQIIGPRGGSGPERTVVRGEPFPPTPATGSKYKLIDRTRLK